MDIKKLAPWNWFKNEEAAEAKNVPVKHAEKDRYYSPLSSLHSEIDRIFDNAFRNFGSPSMNLSKHLMEKPDGILLKPNVDIAASDKEYTITVEVPGVDDENIKLELADGMLIVRGEKKQESEQKERDFYRVERSYGSFQRVLTLPEDTDEDNIGAKFKNGVLIITLPRKEVSTPKGKEIEIKKVA